MATAMPEGKVTRREMSGMKEHKDGKESSGSGDGGEEKDWNHSSKETMQSSRKRLYCDGINWQR